MSGVNCPTWALKCLLIALSGTACEGARSMTADGGTSSGNGDVGGGATWNATQRIEMASGARTVKGSRFEAIIEVGAPALPVTSSARIGVSFDPAVRE